MGTYTTGGVTFTMVLTPVASSSLVEAAREGDAWVIKYVAADGSLLTSGVNVAGETNAVKSKAYSISVYADTALTTQIVSGLGATPNLKITVAAEAQSGTTQSRVHAFVSGKDNALADNAYAADSDPLAVSIPFATTISTNSESPTLVGYCAVWYSGETAADGAGKYTADSGAPSIKINLTGAASA